MHRFRQSGLDEGPFVDHEPCGPVPCQRLTTLAAGAAGGKFLQYEEDAPIVAAQTAYGIEAEVEGYEGAYPTDLMLFMDFRRHHTGLFDATASNVEVQLRRWGKA